MKRSTAWYTILVLIGCSYFYASKYLLDKVYNTIDIVVDELFHIPQGMAFCLRELNYWNPKITTLPGLYIVSMAFLGTYFDCSSYNLRFINLAASVVNYFLFASILNFVYGNLGERTILQALNLVLLPPLYFFSLVYYTDTLSLTFLLAFSRLCFTSTFKLPILAFGIFSILMRQTNVVWIAMVFGHKALELLIRSSRVFGNTDLSKMNLRKNSIIAQDIDNSKLKRYYNLGDLYIAVKYHASTCFVTFFRYLNAHDFFVLTIHLTILLSFVVFVIVNGSIVVGDKTAHEPVIHIPQLFYFLIFYGVFGLPYVFLKFNETVKIILRNKLKIAVLGILFAIIVHYNTIVHPYLLADNRHYTFYIWNRWYGKYAFARYATIPVYLFLLVNLYANLKDQNCISFLLPYTICLCAVLCLQKMIEIRYFLIPFIIVRLRFVRPTLLMLMSEFLWYACINIATFYVFFDKVFFWEDFSEPQRIIW